MTQWVSLKIPRIVLVDDGNELAKIQDSLNKLELSYMGYKTKFVVDVLGYANQKWVGIVYNKTQPSIRTINLLLKYRKINLSVK